MRKSRGKMAIILGRLACLLILSIQFFREGIQSNAAETTDSEIVVLVDNSYSVQKVRESISDWTGKLGIYIQNTGIVMHLKCFDDIECVEDLYDGEIVYDADNNKNAQLEEYKAGIKRISFNKEWTDQAGAMKKAVEILKSSNAKRKCIVMLSDAVLDYEIDANQEEGVKSFAKAVDDFAEEDNQEVILIKFTPEGTEESVADETKVQDIYKECNKAKIFDGDELTEDVLQAILGDLGIVNKVNPVTIQNNRIEYNLDEDCYRMIFVAESNDDITFEAISHIDVFKGEEQIKEEFPVTSGNSCYLYFKDVEQGLYVITVPDSNWKCRIIEQSKADINNIKLFIEQGDDKESKIDELASNKYLIRGDSFKLVAEIETYPSYPVAEIDYLVVRYQIVLKEDKKQEEDDISAIVATARQIHNKSNNGRFEQVIDIMDCEGEYECLVIVQQENKVCAYESILLRIEHESNGAIETLPDQNVKADVSISLEEVFGGWENDKDYTLSINGDEGRITGDRNGEGYEYKDKKLTLLKTGNYDVLIYTSEGERKEVRFIVEETCFWKKIKNWFAERIHSH